MGDFSNTVQRFFAFSRSEEAVDKLKIFDDLINITMTYRKDSNVLNSFGRLQAKSVMAKKAKKEGKWAEFSFDKEEINASEGRSLDIGNVQL